jgi:NAD(P)-dependent dehydrogenase (short-subunit alcohol dehydrogenase family)
MIERILISGGSGGIGGAIARACAARGAWPIVAYRGNEARAQRTVQLCGAGETLRIDLEQDELGLVDRLPAADAVVHCAGMYSPQSNLLEAGPSELARLLAVNALGPLRLTKALLNRSPGLRQVVFVLSTAVACRGTGPYALSKTAGMAVARLLANELAPRGVRVDAIVPGWTDTDMASAAAKSSGRDLDRIRSGHIDGQILQPQEIGDLCAELLFEAPARDGGHLVVWDRRDSRDPAWLGLDAVFSLDPELAQRFTKT